MNICMRGLLAGCLLYVCCLNAVKRASEKTDMCQWQIENKENYNDV